MGVTIETRPCQRFIEKQMKAIWTDAESVTFLDNPKLLKWLRIRGFDRFFNTIIPVWFRIHLSPLSDTMINIQIHHKQL